MAEMDFQTAGLARRLAALTYDILLLTGALFVLALPMPLIDEATRATWWVQLSVQFTVLGFSFFFFGWFWTRSGQTLGMRAWRLTIQCNDGKPVMWREAFIRYFVALLSWLPVGLIGCWVLIKIGHIDNSNYALLLLVFIVPVPVVIALRWHDQLSQTRMIVVPKPARHH